MSAWLLHFFPEIKAKKAEPKQKKMLGICWGCWYCWGVPYIEIGLLSWCCFWGVPYKSILWAFFFSDVGLEKLQTHEGPCVQVWFFNVMIQKNQVTNGHLQKLNMKSDSNLSLETKLHVDSFWWHQTLKRSCLKLHELKVPQNLLKKLSISPRNWKHNNLPPLCVFWLSFNLHFSGTNTSTSWATISSNFFCPRYRWGSVDLRDWHYPVSTYRKKSEKGKDWFLRNLTTNKEILDWLLTIGRPGRILCKTNLQRCMICWFSGTNLIIASGVLLALALLLRRPPGGIRYRHLFFFSSDSWLGE